MKNHIDYIRIIRNENGQVLVLAAILMAVLMGFAALAIDVGMTHYTKGKLQNAADAAALAGARELPDGPGSNAVEEAIKYAKWNGAAESDIGIDPKYKNDSHMIEVVCSKEVPYSFAKVLGLADTHVSARAVALKSAAMAAGPAFDYAIFTSDPYFYLNLSGNNEVTGTVHSNAGVNMSGNAVVNGSVECVSHFSSSGINKITGTCRAATITKGGVTTIGKEVRSPAPAVSMAPDFSDLIKSEADAAGTIIDGNKAISGNSTIGDPIYIKGNLTVSGNTKLNFTAPIYVDGNIIIEDNYSYAGSCIFATGNISISGNNTFPNTKTLIYSKNGDITISGNSEPNGVVFAPNGRILITGNAVHGRVVGGSVEMSGNLKVTSGADDLICLPGGTNTVKLVE